VVLSGYLFYYLCCVFAIGIRRKKTFVRVLKLLLRYFVQFLYILIRCKFNQTFVDDNAIITHVYNINLAPSRYAYLTSMSFANLSNCRHYSVTFGILFSTNVLIYFAAFNSFIVFRYRFLCVFLACVANVSLCNFFFVFYAPRCLNCVVIELNRTA